MTNNTPVLDTKICVIGHFGFSKVLLNGQTIKTKIITSELEKYFGITQIMKIDTCGGIYTYIKLLLKTMYAFVTCNNIIIFPARHGVRILIPLLSIINNFFKRQLHYVVIGGWLSSFIKNKYFLRHHLAHFHNIYVETMSMKEKLEKLGLKNIIVMPNCKELKILREDELVYNILEPYKLCTFSRVLKDKGIEDAIEAVISVNKKYGRTVYTLDIYGPVKKEDTIWFSKLIESVPSYIKYTGIIDFDKSVDKLKCYFALLFPTKFYTEGIPGTIIDAYASGIPVICSKWDNFYEIIDDGITGIGYSFNDKNGLVNTLTLLAENPEKVNSMKIACLLKANDFSVSKAVATLCRQLNGGGKWCRVV